MHRNAVGHRLFLISTDHLARKFSDDRPIASPKWIPCCLQLPTCLPLCIVHLTDAPKILIINIITCLRRFYTHSNCAINYSGRIECCCAAPCTSGQPFVQRAQFPQRFLPRSSFNPVGVALWGGIYEKGVCFGYSVRCLLRGTGR